MADVETTLLGDLIGQLESFCDFGAATVVEEVDGICYFVNEFWTSRQRQGARIHEVSYRACFKPQLPLFFIERLSEPGDLVYDPFMGRGTTLVEAALNGRVPVGNDVNPVSRALVEARINPPSLAEVGARLGEIPWDEFVDFECEELLAFYHPETLAKLEGLRRWLIERERMGVMEKVDEWIRMVAINRLTGHSSGFFSVYTLPPNQAVSVRRQLKINEKRGQFPPLRDVSAIILKKSKSLLSQGEPRIEGGMFLTKPSHETSEIEGGTVSLTVTSPPFLDIVAYEEDNWLRCWFIGIDPKEVGISKHRSVVDWQEFTRKTLVELERVTKPGGYIIYEVGEVRNGEVRLEEQVIEAARGLSLEILGVMVNEQEFTKTANCWGVSNNVAGTNSNRMVIFRKVDGFRG